MRPTALRGGERGAAPRRRNGGVVVAIGRGVAHRALAREGVARLEGEPEARGRLARAGRGKHDADAAGWCRRPRSRCARRGGDRGPWSRWIRAGDRRPARPSRRGAGGGPPGTSPRRTPWMRCTASEVLAAGGRLASPGKSHSAAATMLVRPTDSTVSPARQRDLPQQIARRVGIEAGPCRTMPCTPTARFTSGGPARGRRSVLTGMSDGWDGEDRRERRGGAESARASIGGSRAGHRRSRRRSRAMGLAVEHGEPQAPTCGRPPARGPVAARRRSASATG